MTNFWKTEHFACEYGDEEITDKVLWENHCHPRYEMIAVLAGEVFVAPEGKRYRLVSNNVIIIPQLLYHTVKAAKKCNYKRLVIQFDPVALPKRLMEALGERCLFFSSELVKELCRVLLSEDPELYAPLADSILLQMLYEGLKASAKQEGYTENHSLSAVLDYIEKNLCAPMTLDTIALAAKMSKSAFCRLFKEKMKTTPKQYILQKRMATAQKLLEEGMAPTIVAEAVGYQNYSDFYRIYKKTFAFSPKTATYGA